jgi:hypothetical protein
VLVRKHIEKIEGEWTERFYVACGCKSPLLFDSEEEAATAWNKANPSV